MTLPKCDCCGRFHTCGPGSAWKMIYSGYPPTPDREITRCKKCVDLYGEFVPDDRIKEGYSVGVAKGGE